MNKIDTPPLPSSTVAKQPLVPTAQALTWLAKAQADKVEFRAPVEVRVSALGVEGGSLGFGSDRIPIKLDDSRLGMGLADRTRALCGQAPTCAMWVWGNWQDGTLVINRVEKAIKDDERSAATHLHVAQ